MQTVMGLTSCKLYGTFAGASGGFFALQNCIKKFGLVIFFHDLLQNGKAITGVLHQKNKIHEILWVMVVERG